MELWCKSKRWVNTIVLDICILRDQLIFLSAKVEGQMLVFPVDMKQLVTCSELHILVFSLSHVVFGVGGQSPLPSSCCATEMSSSSPCPVPPSAP